MARRRRRAPRNARITGEIETSPGNRNFPGPTKPTTARTISAAVTALFKDAVKAVTRRDEDEPPPQTRRRSGETDKGFVAACRTMLRRAAKTGAAARGRFATLQPAKAEPEAASNAYTGTGLYLADTLDWLSLWQDNANNEQGLDDNFSAQQDHYLPQP
jgi:hypothetical protein